MQLARTRDTHRAKQSCTLSLRTFVEHVAHSSSSAPPDWASARHTTHPWQRLTRSNVRQGRSSLYFRFSFSSPRCPSRALLPPFFLPFFFGAAAALDVAAAALSSPSLCPSPPSSPLRVLPDCFTLYALISHLSFDGTRSPFVRLATRTAALVVGEVLKHVKRRNIRRFIWAVETAQD